jgi:hypothetical protein
VIDLRKRQEPVKESPIDKAVLKCAAMMCYCTSWLYFGTNDADGFFHTLAFGFFFQFFAEALPLKYRDFNFRLNIIGICITFANIIDELFCNPEAFEWNEIVFSLITVLIACCAKRNQRLFRYLY